MTNSKLVKNPFELKYGDEYRKGKGHCAPTNPNHQFTGQTSSAVPTYSKPTSDDASNLAKSALPVSQEMVFGCPVIDYIYSLLPNGVPEGSRHPWMLKLANDLLILCDDDAQKVKDILLSLQWVKDVTVERNMEELDRVIDSAKKLKQKRESENLYELLPSREMRRAIEKVTQRKYKMLVLEAHQKAMGNLDPSQRDDITQMLERIGKELKKLFPYYPLLRLLCHRLKCKHYLLEVPSA